MFTTSFWRDVAERMLRGAITGFLTIFLVFDPLTGVDVGLWQAAAYGGLHGAGTVLLGLLTRPVGSDASASVLVPPPPEPDGDHYVAEGGV